MTVLSKYIARGWEYRTETQDGIWTAYRHPEDAHETEIKTYEIPYRPEIPYPLRFQSL